MNLPELHVMATTPSQMETAQEDMSAWCDSAIAHERGELWTATENYEIARKAKWKSSPWQSECRKHRRKIEFYEKIKAAIEAGYYIVPPFPVDVFAIRTNRRRPRKDESTYSWQGFQQSSVMLPVGEGEYVSDMPEIWYREIPDTRKGKEGEIRKHFYPKEFQEVDFPFRMVKPAVIDATQKAMAKKIFDQFGVLPNRRSGDPIVVGQIKRPGSRYGDPITFFIAWWLNTDDL